MPMHVRVLYPTQSKTASDAAAKNDFTHACVSILFLLDVPDNLIECGKPLLGCIYGFS